MQMSYNTSKSSRKFLSRPTPQPVKTSTHFKVYGPSHSQILFFYYLSSIKSLSWVYRKIFPLQLSLFIPPVRNPVVTIIPDQREARSRCCGIPDLNAHQSCKQRMVGTASWNQIWPYRINFSQLPLRDELQHCYLSSRWVLASLPMC